MHVIRLLLNNTHLLLELGYNHSGAIFMKTKLAAISLYFSELRCHNESLTSINSLINELKEIRVFNCVASRLNFAQVEIAMCLQRNCKGNNK